MEIGHLNLKHGQLTFTKTKIGPASNSHLLYSFSLLFFQFFSSWPACIYLIFSHFVCLWNVYIQYWLLLYHQIFERKIMNKTLQNIQMGTICVVIMCGPSYFLVTSSPMTALPHFTFITPLVNCHKPGFATRLINRYPPLDEKEKWCIKKPLDMKAIYDISMR